MTDPQTGIEAALSAFDAQFATSAFFEKNDFVVNNDLLGGGDNVIRQDLAAFSTEISKQTATGTHLSVRHLTDYDASTAPADKRKPGTFCKNCNLIQSKEGEWRPCSIIPGKAVNENGWCIAWVGRV